MGEKLRVMSGGNGRGLWMRKGVSKKEIKDNELKGEKGCEEEGEVVTGDRSFE